MFRWLPLVLASALMLALALLASAQTSTPEGITANLDAAIQKVDARDAAGALAAVKAADSMFDGIEKALEQENLKAEGHVEDGNDTAIKALPASPPDLAAAGQALQSARAGIGQLLAPAGLTALPKTGGGVTAMAVAQSPYRAGFAVIALFFVLLGVLAWCLPRCHFSGRYNRRRYL